MAEPNPYLTAMGIMQWEAANSAAQEPVLQNSHQLVLLLPAASNRSPSEILNDAFVQSVLTAMNITADECRVFFDSGEVPTRQSNYLLWDLTDAHALPVDISVASLIQAGSLEQLQHDGRLKRHLWQQLWPHIERRESAGELA